ncbi:MAG TPA: polyketide synthase dehydratase domain-containing protein, partial [Candidatus Polarisedimenticolia bacterium]|nr:polyketide synthase dehydratase domain-containing protein [Candidatus Polarisedimenticolia bacterium]
ASGALAVSSQEEFIGFMLDLNKLYERLAGQAKVPEAMLVAAGSVERERVVEEIERSGRRIFLAMDNCPHQVVLCGSREDLEPFMERLRGAGALCETLPFSRPYHTPLFQPVCDLLVEFYGRLPIALPKVEMYSCASAGPIPADIESIRRLSVDQWALPVRFRETIEAMYADGVRLFVEVGPRGNLSAFIGDILRGRPHLAVPADVRHSSSMMQLHHLIGLLAAHGVSMNLDYLYARREARGVSFEANRPGARTGGRRGSALKLPTGCPPMELSEETAQKLRPRLAGSAPPRPEGEKREPAPQSVTPPTALLPLLSAHMQTMEQFLRMQQEVMTAYLAGRGARPVAAPPLAIPAVRIEPPPAAPVPVASAPAKVVSEAPAIAIPPAAAPVGRGAPALADTLLRLVSERTGYPPEMLDLGLDLEADLGIDSIKRVEIFGSFQKETAALKPGDMELLSTRKTLQDVLDFLSSAAAPSEAPRAPGKGPFIQTVLSHDPGVELVARCDVTLQDLPFLADHCLGRQVSLASPGLRGLPVMPLTMSLEMMAEAAAYLEPGLVVIGMRDVQAHRWMALEGALLRLKLTARRVAGPSSHEFHVSVAEEPIDAPAAPGRTQPIVEARVILAQSYPPPPEAIKLPLEDSRPSTWRSERLYEDGMFHGPAFRGVVSMDTWAPNGALATLTTLPAEGLFDRGRTPALVTDPVLLDQPGQVVGFWMAEHLDRGYVIFPFRIDALHLYGDRPEAGRSLKCRALIKLIGDRQVRSDLDVVGSDGRLWCRFVGWEDLRFDLPRSLFRTFLSPQEETLSEPCALPAGGRFPSEASAARRIGPATLPADLLKSHGGLWRLALAHLSLTPRELDEWRRLMDADRQLDWLTTRLAAKDAARALLSKHYDVRALPADIEVAVEADGRLRLEGVWSEKIGHPLYGSITRSEGAAVAVVSDPLMTARTRSDE